ncbi:hypothetical protein BT96DRAFT_120047 [Gymnopus androsaceus JB14]|uniref:Secreted protein n=1 Tax=Gymnopus androsaceus JB14 TaxID=1447944 RepID=A0A6A4HGY5_9AGAR|nr:hypothetical protein BT96DRAFT_120047 [Gymnopus androsaceus JB14]
MRFFLQLPVSPPLSVLCVCVCVCVCVNAYCHSYPSLSPVSCESSFPSLPVCRLCAE